MTKLSEKIIGKIKGEHIAPVPRWHFLLRGYVFWTLLAASLLLGSLSFSVIAHLVNVGDVDIFNHLKGNIFTSTVMLLPYFWFFSLLLFALVAYYNWKHTKMGYRFKRRWIFAASIVVSVFLGSILQALGMGNEVDRLMAKSLSLYDESKNIARVELWQQPEKGLIMGKIVEISPTGETVVVQDNNGDAWKVSNVAGCRKKANEIERKGKTIKVIGKKSGEKTFDAQEIRQCGDCMDDEEKDDDDKDVKLVKNTRTTEITGSEDEDDEEDSEKNEIRIEQERE